MRAGLALLLLLLAVPASAQQNHERHHPLYQSWVNRQGTNCCNNQDCGELKPENERVTGSRIEVRIEGSWCPVLPEHYLKTGNAPDWSTSHVCVRKRNTYNAMKASCDLLLCYQPKPLF